jgi:Leucine-rich repeat (LRR) protein
MKRTLKLMVEAAGESAGRWGDLRSVLASERGEALLAKLQELVDKWPDKDELEDAVYPYIMQDRNFMSMRGRRLTSYEQLQIANGIFMLALGLVSSFSLGPSWPGAKGTDDWLLKFSNTVLTSHIEQLFLDRSEISDVGVSHFIRSTNFNKIKKLDLSETKISSKAVRMISNSSKMNQLNWLSLSKNKIGDEGAITISNSPNLKSIELLDLSRNQIGDDGVIAIANSKNLSSLKDLFLLENDISDMGALALMRSEKLYGVTDIIMKGNLSLSKNMIDTLKKDKRFVL